MKTIEKIFDSVTGEETIIEKDENPVDTAHRLEIEKLFAENLAAKAEAQIKREAAVAKLEQLGLTEDDLKALGL